jgi:hypothetical protein
MERNCVSLSTGQKPDECGGDCHRFRWVDQTAAVHDMEVRIVIVSSQDQYFASRTLITVWGCLVGLIGASQGGVT